MKVPESDTKARASREEMLALAASDTDIVANRLRGKIDVATQFNPDEVAEATKISQKTGIAVDAALSNMPEAKKVSEKDSINYRELAANYTGTTEYLQRKDYSRISSDDVSHLQGIEWTLKAPLKKFQDSWDDVSYSEIGWNRILGKQASPSDLKLVERIKGRKPSDYGAGEPFSPSANLIQAAGIAPSIVRTGIEGIGGRAAGTLVGAGVGLAGTAITKNPALVAAGAKVGGDIGQTVGGFTSSYRQNAGAIYNELIDERDVEGNAIDPNVARYAALTAAAPIAGLDAFSLDRFAKSFPNGIEGVKKLILKEKIVEAIKNPTIYKALQKNLLKYGENVGVESLTEGVQQFVQVLFEDDAKRKNNLKSGTKFEEKGLGGALVEGAETTFDTAQGMLVLGAAGPISNVSTTKFDMSKQTKPQVVEQVQTERVQAFSQLAQESKTLKRLPEATEAHIQAVKESGGIQNAYIPANRFIEVLSSKGIDPMAMAQELGIESQMQEANRIGTDLVIPIEKYFTKLASTEYALTLKDDTKFEVGELTINEANQQVQEEPDIKKVFEEEAAKQKKKATEDKELTAIEQNITNQVLKAKQSKSEARGIGALYKSFFSQMSSLSGMKPMEIFNAYSPKVQAKSASPLRIGELGQKFYHGTSSKFEKFDRSFARTSSKANPSDLGVWFADDKGYASLHGDRVIEANLNLSNPKKYTSKQWQEIDKKGDFKALREELVNQGFDGILVEPSEEMLGKSKVRNAGLAVAFDEGKIETTNTDSQLFQSSPTTDSQAFKNWFGNSKVTKGGKPKVVYHGSQNAFETFDLSRVGENGFSEGVGFYFTDDQNVADGYSERTGNLFAVYLSIQKPMSLEQKKISKAQLKKIFQELYEQNPDALSNYGDVQYEGLASVLNTAVEMEYEGNRTDVELIASIGNSGVADRQAINNAVINVTGYDGVILKAGESKNWTNGELYVAFNPTQIKSVNNQGTFDSSNPNMLQQGQRGSIYFGKGETLINLFNTRNESTMLHESGHLFFKIFSDLARLPNVDPQLAKDLKATLDWLGVKDISELDLKDGEKGYTKWQVEKLEKFARGWETYMMEGKAPSNSLARVFTKFKNWLVAIYREAANLGAPITDEMRGVFSRLLATNEEISAAAEKQENQPMFKTPEEAGMTRQQFETYVKLNKTVIETAEGEILSKAVKRIGSERKATFREIKSKIQKEVAAEANRLPVYRAEKFIKYGVLDYFDDKGRLVNQSKVDMKDVMTKLNREFVEDYISKSSQRVEQIVKGNKTTTVNRTLTISDSLLHKDGVHPDEIADLVGMPSGLNMLEWLGTWPSKDEYIRQETNSRLALTFDNELLTEESIKSAAEEALHSQERFEPLQMELQALEKLSGQKVASIAQMKRYAQESVAKQNVEEISASNYFSAAKRAAKASIRAMGNKKYDIAVKEKEKQLANLYLYKESMAALETIEKTQSFFKAIMKGKKLEDLTKAGNGYADQTKGILELYGFVVPSDDQRPPLRKWVEERELDGDPIVIDEAILDNTTPVNFKKIPFEHFNRIKEAVENIVHVAKISNDFITDMYKVSRQEAANEIIQSLQQVFKGKFEKAAKGPEMATPEDAQSKDNVRGIDDSLRITEFKIEEIDGYKQGAAYKYLFRPVVKAADRVVVRGNEAAKKVSDILSTYQQNELLERVFVSEVNEELTKENLLSVLLNCGNEGNMSALINGYPKIGGVDGLVKMLEKYLTKKDFDVAQKIWDLFETYRNEVQEANIKRTGVKLKMVEARPIVTKFGTYKGGYYPIAYDRRKSQAVHDRDAITDVKELYNAGSFAPMTRHSHRKARSGGDGSPIRLDLGVVGKHLNEVIIDIEMFDAIRGVDRLINEKELSKALGIAQGTSFKKWLRDWITSTVNDGPVDAGYSSAFNYFKANMSVAFMGLKFTTAISQVMGLTTTMDEIGAKWTQKGYSWYYNGDKEAKLKFIYDLSPQMANRSRSFDRDVKQAISEFNKKKTKIDDAKKHLFIFTVIMDREVSAVTWAGAFQKVKAEQANISDELAAEYADSVVRKTQGSGNNIALAKELRSRDGYKRLWTSFYSFYNVLYNRFARTAGMAASGKMSAGQIATSLAYLWFIPATIGSLIVGQGPKDDEEWWKWLMRVNITYPLYAIPVFGPIASAAIQKAMGNYYARTTNPVGVLEEATGKLLIDVVKFPERDAYENIRELSDSAINAAGIYYGFPSAQFNITKNAFLDQLEGQEVYPQDYLLSRRR